MKDVTELPSTGASSRITPIRILTVTTRLSPAGGIPKVIRTILRLSNPSLVQHYVCQIRPLIDDLSGEHMPSLKGLHSLGLRGPWTRSPSAIPAALKLMRIIRRVRPDIVHLHTGSSLVALPARFLLRANIRWLLDLHEPMRIRHSELTSRLVAAMSQGEWCVTHSPGVADEVQSRMELSGDRHALIPLGIEVERFRNPKRDRTEWRDEFGFREDQILVVTVGRVTETKGIGRLLDIAARMPSRCGRRELIFAIIGRLVSPDDVFREIHRRNLETRIKPLGFVEDLPSALNAADVFLSTSSYEGFGLAVVEGMAAGLPVVASDVGGLTFVVEHGRTGYLVEPDDLGGFVGHLVRLGSDSSMKARIGEQARQRAISRFDESVMVRGYERLYSEMASGRRPKIVPTG